MKEFFLIFSLFLFPIVLYSQTQEEPELGNSGQIVHDKKDASISLSPNLVFDTPNGRTFAGGFKLKTYLGKRFSFDSDLLFGRDFMQFSPGFLGVLCLLSGFDWSFGPGEDDNTFAEFLMMGISVLLSAEHFSYHIPVTNNTEISPYISLLRFRGFTMEENSDKGKSYESSACFAAGIEVNKYFNRFILSPYVDYSIGYSRPFHGFACGINFGYYFPHRNR
jgi:hypothetical protein